MISMMSPVVAEATFCKSLELPGSISEVNSKTVAAQMISMMSPVVAEATYVSSLGAASLNSRRELHPFLAKTCSFVACIPE